MLKLIKVDANSFNVITAEVNKRLVTLKLDADDKFKFNDMSAHKGHLHLSNKNSNLNCTILYDVYKW